PTGAATPVTGATHPVTCGRVTDSTPHRAARTNSLGWMPRSCYFRNMFHKSLQRTAVPRPRSAGLTLAAVAVVQFLVSLDLSVVNVGLPRIADGLGFTRANLAWVVHAYALTFGGL